MAGKNVKETSLTKLAISVSILGILILLFISENINTPILQISSISYSMIDKQVKIQGTVVSVKPSESATVLDVGDITGNIKIVVFERINLVKGNQLEVLGKVQ